VVAAARSHNTLKGLAPGGNADASVTMGGANDVAALIASPKRQV
jgi:hypothetical protein